MGICNLRRIDECIEKRKRVYERYFEHLNGADGIKLCAVPQDVESNYAYFPVYFDKTKFGKSRDDVFEQLKEQDIFARKYFYPAINELSCYKGQFPLDTPNAHKASMGILTLPMYEGLKLEDVDRICDIILK